MSYSFYNDKSLTYWTDRPLVAAEAFAQMAAFLSRLQTFNEIFSQFYVANLNTMRYVGLQPDLSDLRDKLIAGFGPDDGFVNTDPDDYTFHINSRSVFGFSGSFSTVAQETEIGCQISVTCGCFDAFPGSPGTNLVDIVPSSSLATPEFLRGLLKEMVDFWRPADALITRPNVRSLLEQPVGEAAIGWLTYLADPAAATVVPDEFAHEPLADGILIQAADRPGKEDDAEYVARLIRLRDALKPDGFLSNRTAMSARAQQSLA